MQWEIIVALMLAVPVILLPVMFVWYLNMGGLSAVFKRAREKQAVSAKSTKVVT